MPAIAPLTSATREERPLDADAGEARRVRREADRPQPQAGRRAAEDVPGDDRDDDREEEPEVETGAFEQLGEVGGFRDRRRLGDAVSGRATGPGRAP